MPDGSIVEEEVHDGLDFDTIAAKIKEARLAIVGTHRPAAGDVTIVKVWSGGYSPETAAFHANARMQLTHKKVIGTVFRPIASP